MKYSVKMLNPLLGFTSVKCGGTFFCQNQSCSFLKRFDVMNQVQMDKKRGEYFCVSCGLQMRSVNCEGKKYVAYNKSKMFVVVKHEENHVCVARSTFETDVIKEIEEYFSMNALSSPFEAIVNHLNKKINFENAEKGIQDLVKASLRKWDLKNAKARVKKRNNPFGPTLEAARLLRTKLFVNAKNPYNLKIIIKEDSYVCRNCNYISEQELPDDPIEKNCPTNSCNQCMMERTGPYVFIASEESLKTLRDLNVGGELEDEALHIDFQPSRIKRYTCLATYCYDLDLRCMGPGYTAILTKETEMSVYLILELVRKLMLDVLQSPYNPALYMADEATALKNGVIREHGMEKLGFYGTCELHYMKSVFMNCSDALGSQQKQFEHLKFAEGLLHSVTPAVYEKIYIAYQKWVNERSSRREALGDWLDWWHQRRSGWSQAFRNVDLPRTNLAEVGNCKYSPRTGMTNMAIDVGMQAIIAEHQEQAERKRGVLNGDFLVGKGRSRCDLNEKQIKDLVKRIKDTPANSDEESNEVNRILQSILDPKDQIFEEFNQPENMLAKNIQARESAILNSPTHHGAVHRPPKKTKVTPVKKRRDEDGDMPMAKRARLNLVTNKDTLLGTMDQRNRFVEQTQDIQNENKSNNNSQKRQVNVGELTLRRAMNTYCQMTDIEQIEEKVFVISIMKANGTCKYKVSFQGVPTCECIDFKQKNKQLKDDSILCKHHIYVLVTVGIDPVRERALVTKWQYNQFTEEDRNRIAGQMMSFDEANFVSDPLFKRLEEAVVTKPKKQTSVDKILAKQDPLPYIDETRFYSSYESKDKAMYDLSTNSDRFFVTWYALRAPTGRKQCPGGGVHESKCIKKGQLCFAADFSSVMKIGEVFKVKDQRRLFCMNTICLTKFEKRELKTFSNISKPRRVDISRLDVEGRNKIELVMQKVNETGL